MKKKIIYEGKAKKIFSSAKPNELIQHFKDDATAFNNKKKSIIPGKGIINNFISELLMTKLSELNIPNHFIKRINMREQIIYKLDIIPIEVVIRNVSSGSIVKRLGIDEGKVLSKPLIEFFYKKDELDDPLISDEHILNFGWATEHELEEIISLSLRINDFLSGYFMSINVRLIDFKLEFGRMWKNDELIIMLADEISPDNCRLWDTNTNKKLDKDRFRHNLGDEDVGYKEIAFRLGVLSEKEFKKVLKNEI